MFRNNRRISQKNNEKDSERDTERDAEIHAPDGLEIVAAPDGQNVTTAISTVANLFNVYQSGAVFSQPMTVGDNTVITAADVQVAMGMGVGHGTGGTDESGGEGSGGGGGGFSAGRPVAAIIISPTGVRVEPIVDVTKIALAFFTMLGAIFMAWRAMRRQSAVKRS
jgi:uncharacterized spore protein YtfJ